MVSPYLKDWGVVTSVFQLVTTKTKLKDKTSTAASLSLNLSLIMLCHANTFTMKIKLQGHKITKDIYIYKKKRMTGE